LTYGSYGPPPRPLVRRTALASFESRPLQTDLDTDTQVLSYKVRVSFQMSYCVREVMPDDFFDALDVARNGPNFESLSFCLIIALTKLHLSATLGDIFSRHSQGWRRADL
jgi:hypothetical protein